MDSFLPSNRHAAKSCTPAKRNKSPRRFNSASSPCNTLRPNSRSLSTATARAWGSPWVAYALNSTPFLKSISHNSTSSGEYQSETFVMSACSKVLLPEPVLPASKTCWRVPSPISMDCNLLAPLRPTGTRKILALELVHRCSGLGSMAWNGTSTLEPALASRPIFFNMVCNIVAAGIFTGVNGTSSRPGASTTNRSSRQRRRAHRWSNSSSLINSGSGCAGSRNNKK